MSRKNKTEAAVVSKVANPELNTFNAIKLDKLMTCVNVQILTPLVLILLKPDVKSIDQSKARSLNIAYTKLQHEVKRNRKETFEWRCLQTVEEGMEFKAGHRSAQHSSLQSVGILQCKHSHFR